MASLLCRASDPEWLDLRKQGVTATDITVIAGLVGWDSPWCLFWRKRGLLPEVEQTDRMRLGGWLEDSLIIEWRQQHDHSLPFAEHGLYASEARPWQMATPDAVTGHAVLEVKTSATRDGWGDDGTADVPAHVRAQVLWQMDTLGVAQGHVAVCFLPSGEFRSYTISHEGPLGDVRPGFQPSCEVCADQLHLRQLGLEFYQRLQGELPPPDVDGLAVTTAGLKRLHADPGAHLRAELPPALVDAWDTERAARTEANKVIKDHSAENAVRDALDTAMVGTVDGRPVIERRFGKRAGYTVEPLETDQLKRIKGADDE